MRFSQMIPWLSSTTIAIFLAGTVYAKAPPHYRATVEGFDDGVLSEELEVYRTGEKLRVDRKRKTRGNQYWICNVANPERSFTATEADEGGRYYFARHLVPYKDMLQHIYASIPAASLYDRILEYKLKSFTELPGFERLKKSQDNSDRRGTIDYLEFALNFEATDDEPAATFHGSLSR